MLLKLLAFAFYLQNDIKPKEEKAPEGDLVAAFHLLKGDIKRWRVTPCQSDNDRTRGNGFKLIKGRFNLDIRKKGNISRL